MDKIQKALEKVQREKTENSIREDQEKQTRGQVGSRDQGESASSFPMEISYHRSKVVKTSDERLMANRLVACFDNDLISDQYKIIKTKIIEQTKAAGLNTILVTSAFREEGKSLTAANLAISLAKEATHTVLLVDADLRRPSQHKLFDIKPAAGLSDYLLKDAALPDLLINPGIRQLLLLPGHQSVGNSSEVVGAPRMEKLVAELKVRYPERYVIFDSPPLIESADSLILSKYLDGVILVVEAGKTQIPHIKKSLELLEDRNLIGLVLNKGEIPDRKHYY